MGDKIVQISLSLTSEQARLVPAIELDRERAEQELRIFRENLVSPLPYNVHLRFSPLAIYFPTSFIDELKRLNKVLNKALDSIVERWWTNERFPSLMPLENHEEELLKWLNDEPSLRAYSGRQGIWRPDYLVEKHRDQADSLLERVKICEINGRFPYNAVFLTNFNQQAATRLRNGLHNLKETFDAEQALDTVVHFFDTSKPLHIIKDEWPGFDVHSFAQYFRECTGQTVTFVKPSELRLRKSPGSTDEPVLYYARPSPIEGNQTEPELEKIFQCSIELIQKELEQLDLATLQQLARCGVNDFRTILLVHDKRMLGVVLDEVDNLIDLGVISAVEGQVLRDGIAPTILSATKAMTDLLRQSEADPKTKDQYMLKPIRGGLGKGHLRGSDMPNEEWLNRLRSLRNTSNTISEQTHVVQRLVDQHYYKVRRHDVEELQEQFHLVPSYYSVNGKYLTHGPVRLGDKFTVHLSEEAKGIMMVSVTPSVGGLQ